MSHFSVLVIGPKNEEELAAALQPFHEFECTGVNDQYVQEIDRTEEVLEDFNKCDEGITFTQFVQDNYGWDVVNTDADIDTNGKHKYGYVVCDALGNIVKCIRRTNPGKKWDWWQIGGRWSGMLYPLASGSAVMGDTDQKSGACNSLRVQHIDMKTMQSRKWQKSNEAFDMWRNAQEGLTPARNWSDIFAEYGDKRIDDARKAYHSQPRVGALHKIGYFSDPIGVYPCIPGVDSEETIQKVRFDAGKKAADRCLSVFAVLDCTTKFGVSDPKWYERGSMGWFGMVSEEKDVDQWERRVNEIVGSLGDDVVITVVDCHI